MRKFIKFLPPDLIPGTIRCLWPVVFAVLFLLPVSMTAQVPWEEERVDLLQRIQALLMEDSGDPEANRLLDELDRKAKAQNDSLAQMKGLIARINQHINNAPYVDSALNIMYHLLPSGDAGDSVEYYIDRGFTASLRGEYKKRVIYLDSALTIIDRADDPLARVYLLNEISLANQNVNDFQSALSAGRRAIRSAQEIGDPSALAWSMRNVGACFLDLDQLDSSRIYITKAYEIYRDNEMVYDAAYTLASIGTLDTREGDYNEAIEKLKTACDSLFKPEVAAYHQENYSQIWTWLAEAYLLDGQYREAEKAAQTAVNITDSLQQEENKVLSMELLLRARLASRPEIRELFEEYSSIQAKLYDDANQRAVLEFEEKFEAKEAERKVLELEQQAARAEIDMQNIRFFVLLGLTIAVVALLVFGLLSLRNRIRTRQRVDQLNLRALQLQINPHFFFNVLNSISNFVGRNDRKSAHFYLGRFAKLMRQTLEFSRENLVELREEMEMLDTYLQLEQLRQDQFDFEINVPEGLENRKIPPMLIQPFVENCVVHAFPKGLPHRGSIRIEVSDGGTHTQLMIEDNGKGLESQEKMRESEGKTSLAIRILEERLSIYRKKDGSIRFEPAFPEKKGAPGTRIIIKIPVT